MKESRMEQLIKALGLKRPDFAREVGINNTTLHNYVKGRPIKAENAAKIVERYPNVNLNWLITGEGEMFVEGKTPKPDTAPTPPESDAVKQLQSELKAMSKKIEMAIAKEQDTAEQVAKLENEIMRLKARLFDEMGRKGILPDSDPGVVSAAHDR